MNRYMLSGVISWLIVCFSSLHAENFLIRNFENNNLNVVYLFVHGLGGNHRQAGRYARIAYCSGAETYVYNDHWIIQDPIAMFDFSEALYNHFKYVDLGQENDMSMLHKAYKKTREQLPNHEIVLLGVSRGATTIINYMAYYRPEHVAAVVLESPFDHINNIAAHILEQYSIDWLPMQSIIFKAYLSYHFPSFNTQGILPILSSHLFPKNVPVLLVHSLEDELIPCKCSRNLYCALRSSGHQQVYFLELKKGKHAKLLKNEQGALYSDVVHAFYKKHGLSKNTIVDTKIHELLSSCTPDITDWI